MSGIRTRLGKCGECRWYQNVEEIEKHYGGTNTGICTHPTRNGKNRHTPYPCHKMAAACFDAEDPEENRQLTLSDLEAAQ